MLDHSSFQQVEKKWPTNQILKGWIKNWGRRKRQQKRRQMWIRWTLLHRLLWVKLEITSLQQTNIFYRKKKQPKNKQTLWQLLWRLKMMPAGRKCHWRLTDQSKNNNNNQQALSNCKWLTWTCWMLNNDVK